MKQSDSTSCIGSAWERFQLFYVEQWCNVTNWVTGMVRELMFYCPYSMPNIDHIFGKELTFPKIQCDVSIV